MKINDDAETKPRSRRLLDRSILLDEKEGPPLVRGALLFGALIVALFVLWASLAGLEEIEIASGEIVPAEDALRIQHPTGGTILELPVKEGSPVAAGQLLARLDPQDSEQVRVQTKSQLHALHAQRERLTATILGRSPDFSSLPAEASIFVEDQKALYAANRALAKLSRETADSQTEQARMELDRIAVRKASLARQLALAEEDAALTRNLVDRGAASRPELLGKLRILEGLKEEQESLAAEAERSAERSEEIRMKRAEIDAETGRQLRSDLSNVNEKIAQIEAQSKRVDLSTGRLDILAPADGIVHALNYRTVGSIVPAGATLMELIPTGRSPKAQLRIDPQSIGSLRTGGAARIKVSAYPYDRYGAFVGTLTDLSPSTFPSPNGRTYYYGIVEISGRELAESEPLVLLPGMTLNAELRTGEKTLLQYLLKPIFASAREAFREK